MSEITTCPDNSFSTVFLNFDKYIPKITNLNESTKVQRQELLDAINKFIEVSPLNDFRISDYFNFFKKHPIAHLSKHTLLSLLYISFLEGNITEIFSPDEIFSNPFLKILYDKYQVFKVSEIFNKLNLPSCFDCTDCIHKENCNYSFITKVWIKLKEKMMSNPIDQNELLSIDYE